MADISLRDYLDKLESLLKRGTPDEVIHHCRHILQYYPKNVAAYRILGQALITSSGLEEAGEVFRRVLGVYPDDDIAHLGLSQVYERTSKPDEAIWHLERAYEHEPNNNVIIEKLRDFYRQYRQVDYPRLQLTSGAVARQNARNGLHNQAIETLRDALEQSPNRVDLRLLLAQTQWESGHEVEAAETALDILKVIPDCLEANRILTLLWLAEGRPSDAQRYLGHIETVDPYLALQLAKDQPIPDNAFMLPEVDYRSVEKRRLDTSQPDWLSELGQTPAATTTAEDWMSAINVAEQSDDLAAESDTSAEDFSAMMPEDWLQDDEPAPAQNETVNDLFAEIQPESDMNDLFAGIRPENETRQSTGLTGLLRTLDNAPEADEEAEPTFDFTADAATTEADLEALEQGELPDWLTDAAPKEAAEQPAMLAAMDEADSLDWLQDSGVEMTDTPSAIDLNFQADEGEMTYQDPGAVNPLSWMEGSGIEITDEVPVQEFFADEGEMTYHDPGAVNPLSWMEGSGIEMTEPAAPVPDFFTDELGTPLQKPVDTDPLAWMQNTDVEIVEDSASAPGAMSTISSMLEAVPTTNAEDDSLEWLKDDSVLDEILDIEDLTDTGGLTSTPEPEILDITPEEPLSMPTPPTIEDLLPQGEDSEEDEAVEGPWRGNTDILAGSRHDELVQADESAEDMARISDWQSDMSDQNDNQLPDWLGSEPSDESESELAAFEWLDNSAPPEPAPSDQPLFEDDESALDWMAELGDEEPLSEASASEELTSGGPDWLIETGEQAETVATTVPGWLDDLNPAQEEPEAKANELDWLTGESSEAQAEPNMPDWLAEAAPTAEMQQPQDEPIRDSEFEWISAEIDAEEAEAEAEPATALPDWLTEAAPAAEIEQVSDEAAIGSEFEWLSSESEAETEMEAEAQPVVAPDWLVDPLLAAEMPEEEAITDSQFEWISAEIDAEEAEAEAEAEPASAIPDWLADAAPAAEMEPAGEEAVIGGEFEWLSSEAEVQEETEAEAETIEAPDWLADAAPITEMEMSPSEPVIGSDFEWLSSEAEVQEETEAEAETIEAPDWLADAAPIAELADEEPVTSSEFEWLTTEPEDEVVAEAEAVGEIPDWLTEAAPATEMEQAQDQPAAEYEWLNIEPEDEAVAEAEAEPTGETPDWLTEAAPASASELAHAEPVVGSDFEWLSSEDTPETEAEIETSAESVPGFVSGATAILDDDGPDFAAPETWSATSEPGWLGELEETGESAEAAPASEWVLDEAISDEETHYDVEPVHSEFGWLDDSADEQVYEPEIMEAEAAIDSEFSDFSADDEQEQDTAWDGELDEVERAYAAANAPPPAENAPDWLNAMVPGLDVDYQPGEDDSLAAAEAQGEKKGRGFDWLTDIVEEETGQMEPIRDVAEPVGRRRRFVFSRKPSWLRRLTERQDSAASSQDKDAANDDFELPDWLQ